MNACRLLGKSVALSASVLLGAVARLALGGTLQQVSLANPAQAPPAGGSGDSCVPLISPDGRYVLFASTANNLLPNSSTNPLPVWAPPSMNVYLCDRTNGTMTLVSVNLAGTGGGNGDSWPAGLSTNGGYALFESSASDLVAGDTNSASDIFVRDLGNQSTLLVSASTNGGIANGASRSAVMTPDGRFVAFVSAANNLVPGDTNGITDVFVRDLQAGVTTLASVGAVSTNGSSEGGSSEAPDLPPDGRYIAFFSTATGLVAGAGTGGDIYVRDLVAGTTAWASVGARPAVQTVLGAANAVSFNHALSADGQYVAYEACPPTSSSLVTAGLILRYGLTTGQTDLVHTNAYVTSGPYEDINSLDLTPDGRFIAFVANTNGTVGTNTCILVWDAQTGAMTLASGDLNHAAPVGATCHWPVMTPDGRFVAFLSSAANLTTNTLNGLYHLYVRDLQAGWTTLVDADTNGAGAGLSPITSPRLSADGRFVAFEGPDGSLVPNDNNRSFDVFVRDLAANTTAIISAHAPGAASLSPNGSSGIGAFALSADGRYLALSSDADDLTSNDTNGLRDIFVRDLLLGANLLVSVSTNGVTSGNGCSTVPGLSSNGRYVVFSSSASNLVPSDTNQAQDVFLRDLQAGTTTLVSVNRTGAGSGNNASFWPTISADGRYILFRSRATDLAAGSFMFTYGTENLFVRDCQKATNYALTTLGVTAAAMTPDGHYAAFDGAVSGGSRLFVWDCRAAAQAYSSTFISCANLGLSPSGKRLAYWPTATTSLSILDWTSNRTWVAASSFSVPARAGLRFSADDRLLAYAVKTASSLPSQVCLYDCQAGTNLLVSHPYANPAAPANGDSDAPDLSPDGRYVVYRSTATNLVPGATHGQPAIFLYDCWSNATVLVSADHSGGGNANNRCLAPLFGGDGQTLLFASWASDLAAQDFNGSADLFAFNPYPAPPFSVQAVAGSTAGQPPLITWPIAPGRTYGVQFKNNLEDANWQNLAGAVNILGAQGFLNDPAPPGAQRFYRVVAF